MEENKNNLPALPEIPTQISDADKIKELETAITNLQFFSDTIRFNNVLYQGISLILEKLTKIEEKLNKDGKKE